MRGEKGLQRGQGGHEEEQDVRSASAISPHYRNHRSCSGLRDKFLYVLLSCTSASVPVIPMIPVPGPSSKPHLTDEKSDSGMLP